MRAPSRTPPSDALGGINDAVQAFVDGLGVLLERIGHDGVRIGSCEGPASTLTAYGHIWAFDQIRGA
jgi:hypothetical protein